MAWMYYKVRVLRQNKTLAGYKRACVIYKLHNINKKLHNPTNKGKHIRDNIDPKSAHKKPPRHLIIIIADVIRCRRLLQHGLISGGVSDVTTSAADGAATFERSQSIGGDAGTQLD